MIKVAHRIISSLIITRDERSTISSLELHILYAMDHPELDLTPYYKSFLFNKLICISTARSSKIHYGDIVTLLAKSLPVRVSYPDNHVPLSNESYLTITVLESMMMLQSVDDCHSWTVS